MGLPEKTLESEFNRLRQEEFDGQRLSAILSVENMGVVENLVLIPLEQAAFKVFQNIDPGDNVAVSQAQQMGKVIGKIRERINEVIVGGQMATQQLISAKNSTQENKDE